MLPRAVSVVVERPRAGSAISDARQSVFLACARDSVSTKTHVRKRVGEASTPNGSTQPGGGAQQETKAERGSGLLNTHPGTGDIEEKGKGPKTPQNRARRRGTTQHVPPNTQGAPLIGGMRTVRELEGGNEQRAVCKICKRVPQSCSTLSLLLPLADPPPSPSTTSVVCERASYDV